MHATRPLAVALLALLPNITACADRLDGPATVRPLVPNGPQGIYAYDRYPTESEFLSGGGRIAPIASVSNPTLSFSTDAYQNTFVKAAGTVTFQYVNLMQALLSVSATNTSTGATVGAGQAPHNTQRTWPTTTPISTSLFATASAGKTSCGITGMGQISATGTLRLLSAQWLPIDFFSFPADQRATPISQPDCTQRKSDETPTTCSNQLIYSPGSCEGTGTTSPTGGGGAGCWLWVRRIYVTYDGGKTWILESETYFTRC